LQSTLERSGRCTRLPGRLAPAEWGRYIAPPTHNRAARRAVGTDRRRTPPSN